MIRLTGNKIAVSPILDPDQTSGGIWIPDVAKERSDQGIVKYIGPDVKNIKPGDYVLFSGYTGTVVNFSDSDGVLIIFREEFAVCKLEDVATPLPGLYYRERQDILHVRAEIARAIENINLTTKEKVDTILDVMEENNPYFEATYETAINLIADSWRNTEFAKSVALYRPGEPGRKKVAANPDYSHDEILAISERENEGD